MDEFISEEQWAIDLEKFSIENKWGPSDWIAYIKIIKNIDKHRADEQTE